MAAERRELVQLGCGLGARRAWEWWAHARMAREHGVDEAIVAAIGRGETPSFEAGDEAVVYTFTRQLLVSGGVDDARFESSVERLGRTGVAELVFAATTRLSASP